MGYTAMHDPGKREQAVLLAPQLQHAGGASVPAPVAEQVRIERDSMGAPHVYASTRADSYVGLGYAMGYDRLWQLDWLRRCAYGRTAEIIGDAGRRRDVEARILGLGRTASASLAAADSESRELIDRFVSGVNLAINIRADDPPTEFVMLGYEPELWTAEDCVALWKSWAWYLSGRLYWIAEHEYILSALPADLAAAVLQPAGDRASIVEGQLHHDPLATGEEDSAGGSNNWVVSGRLSPTGHPFVASDPHVVFWAPSIWYEAQLSSPGEQAAGVCYAGVPGFLIGRNRHVAWGFTNNICSIRDLYRERTDSARPGQYVSGAGEWVPFRERTETIRTGADTDTLTVRETDRGPIVNELIDPALRPSEPVSLAWTGTEPSDEIGAMLRLQLASSVDDVTAALAAWGSPTFNFVYADDHRIGYQCAGSIPVRGRRWLGIRDASLAADQWVALQATSDLPAVTDPDRGWIVSANNRVSWQEDITVQSGFWPSSLRAERIAKLITAGPADLERMKATQLDTNSPRAERIVPTLVKTLRSYPLSDLATSAVEALGDWDYACSVDAVAPTVFEAFMLRWTERVVRERVDDEHVRAVANHAHGLADRLLLAGDEVGWLQSTTCPDAVREVFESAVAELCARLGPLVSRWTWGRVHIARVQHPLDDVAEPGWPYTINPEPIAGSWNTINNSPYDPIPAFSVHLGVSHRIIADLSSTSLLAVNSTGASGDPLSRHYRDAFDELLGGRYHELFVEDDAALEPASRVTLTPRR
jgi:penicillin amidase